MTLAKRHVRLVVLFLVPALVPYLLFVVYPALRAFYVSFFNWRGVSRAMTFVGLDNYLHLANDPIMWRALQHNAFFAIAFPLAILVPATIIALAFRARVRGASLYRAVFMIPNMMSVAVVAVLWAFLYEPQLGLVNAGLRLVGLSALARPWLGDPSFALPALVLPIAWINIGFYMLVIYAGLLNIPQDLYDAAHIDGASEWMQFWRLTLPLLWDIVVILLIYVVVGALNEFSLVLIMTNGGPSRATELMATYMYKLFLGGMYGYGTAVGVVQFLLSAGVLLAARRLMRREALEY